MITANLIRDCQVCYKARQDTLSNRATISPVSNINTGWEAFDLQITGGPAVWDTTGVPNPANTGATTWFIFKLPVGLTTIGSCALRARYGEGTVPDAASIKRYYSVSTTDPLLITDWVEIGDTANLLGVMTAYGAANFADPVVTTARWLAFASRAGATGVAYNLVHDIRQLVQYAQQSIEIQEPGGTVITADTVFTSLYRGSLTSAGGGTRALNLRNNTADDTIVNVKAVFRHLSASGVRQAESRILFSTDNIAFASGGLLNLTVPTGGKDFWIKYLPISPDDSITREAGMGGLYIEILS